MLLSTTPVSLFSLFYKSAAYRVNLLRDGESTALPVYSWFYQILGDCILYLDDETAALKSYNINTAVETTLAENVFEFSVLQDRFVCIEPYNAEPMIYDWQTAQTVKINIPE